VRSELPELTITWYLRAPDSKFARRLIATMKKHRVVEKIPDDWAVRAPDELVAEVTPRPLWM
jgi:hypothetical protein